MENSYNVISILAYSLKVYCVLTKEELIQYEKKMSVNPWGTFHIDERDIGKTIMMYNKNKTEWI